MWYLTPIFSVLGQLNGLVNVYIFLTRHVEIRTAVFSFLKCCRVRMNCICATLITFLQERPADLKLWIVAPDTHGKSHTHNTNGNTMTRGAR